jgi:hypothetical protein
MGAYKEGIGQPSLPLFANFDQIIAIGAIAMQKDNNLLDSARFGGDPWAC